MLKAALFAVVAMLAGCASMAPEFHVPALPVPETYPLDAPAGSGRRAPDMAWRAYFADPRLQQLIGMALQNNRDLRLAALRVQEARATYGIQRAERLPAIDVGGDGSRSRVPASLSVTGRPLVSGRYQVALGANAWEIDFWGRLQSLQDAALQSFLASDAARRAVELLLVAQVADGYLTLRELDGRLVLARRSIASREASLRIFTRRVEIGATSRFDLMQVQTLSTQARALGAQLEQQRSVQAHALGALVGSETDDFAPADAPLDDAAVLQAPATGLPSELLVERPDIVAAEHRLRAANASIGAARAAFFPRIALTSSIGVASAQLDGLFEGASRAWTFSPSITLPIFDAGTRRNALDLAEVRRDMAVADYEKTVQAAFRDVADALSSRVWLEEQVRIGMETLDAQTERARLAKLRYDHGAAAFLEVLDAQRDLLAAEQLLVTTRRMLLSARVALYAALGGGLF